MSSAPPLPAPARPDPPAEWPRCAQLALAVAVLTAAGLVLARQIPALGNRPRPTEARHAAAFAPIDLNRAGRNDLLQLPGVGPRLADQILAARDSRGHFRAAEELRTVPGIGPAVFERIRPWVTVEIDDIDPAEPAEMPRPAAPPAPVMRTAKANAPAGPIDVNHATAEALQTLPGVGPKLSQRIIDERAKKPFATVDELRRVSGIGPKTLEKLRPLVKVGGAAPAVVSTGERI
jgi:competence protein ComEA